MIRLDGSRIVPGDLATTGTLGASVAPPPGLVSQNRYRRLGTVLSEAGYEGYLVGDEGGYGPRLGGNREALDLVVAAIENSNLRPGEQVVIGLDVAATHFFEGDRYQLAADKRE